MLLKVIILHSIYVIINIYNFKLSLFFIVEIYIIFRIKIIVLGFEKTKISITIKLCLIEKRVFGINIKFLII